MVRFRLAGKKIYREKYSEVGAVETPVWVLVGGIDKLGISAIWPTELAPMGYAYVNNSQSLHQRLLNDLRTMMAHCVARNRQ